ncbi:MAG: ISL3 family transposase [Erysipelotrichaceae bacterium]|nr:ISL3 family transposase [Erysipelotrichaceae bacterium]
MKDHEYDKLITNILNISPSDIEQLSVTKEEDETKIYLTIKSHKTVRCPYCSSYRYLSNGFYKRQVIIDNDFIIHEKLFLKVRRYRCSSCGRSFSDKAGIVPNRKKTSYKMVYRIMELLKNPKLTFKSVSELTGVSTQTVTRIFDSHTHIPRIPFPEAICIDEVYTKLNDFKNSKFSCIFYDFYQHRILDILPCRRKHHLRFYLDKIDPKERDRVKFVSIDMYQPYRDIARIYFKKAIICVDSFHVVSHLNDDLNKLRIRIMNSYDPQSQEYYLLNRFKFLLFDRSIDLENKGRFNKRLGRFLNYSQLLSFILSIDKQLETAYNLKELYIFFNSTADYNSASENLDKIIDKFIQADIPEFDEFITLQKNWRNEIINSFSTYKGRRLNSGVAESINHTVSTLLYNTRGIRNSERRRKRIMYAVNKSGFTIQ